MKLLAPKLVKDLSVSQARVMEKEKLELEQAIAEKLIENNNLAIAVETNKSKLDEEFLKFADDLQGKKAQLKQEIVRLELERLEALKPIDELKKDLEIRDYQVSKKELELSDQFQHILDREKSLGVQIQVVVAEKLGLGVREGNILNTEFVLKQRETKVKEQEEKTEHSRLEFKIFVENKLSELATIEADLKNREQEIGLQMVKIEDDRKQIENDRRAIKDGYAQLTKSRNEILGRTE